MTDEKDLNETNNFGTSTGRYVQTYGSNGANIFVIGAETKTHLMLSIILTQHSRLQTPLQMDLGWDRKKSEGGNAGTVGNLCQRC